ncbi:MAG: nucleotidyltransferase family protein [Cognaticolwellia sp.]
MTIQAKDNVAIIVLAAGQSARLGQMKQLIKLKDKSLVEWQLAQALHVSSQVYCVLGFNASQVQARIDHLPITTIINSTWSEGMASSIALGVGALIPETKAVMIVLVDQWQLTSADLRQHISHWQAQPSAIVVAQTGNVTTENTEEKIGPPVIFPQHYFAELRQLTGQQGAKSLLTQYQDKLCKVPLAHAFIDVDTPEQLASLHKKFNAKLNVKEARKP